MKVKFTQFVREISSEDKCRQFLIDKNIFAASIACPRCGNILTLNRCRASLSTSGQKQKRRVQCDFKQSAKTKTWFANVRLSLLTAVTFIAEWLWVPAPRYNFISEDLEVSSHTIVDWSSFCREVRFNEFVKVFAQVYKFTLSSNRSLAICS